MASRNRTAGHNWERTCIKYLSKIFPFIVSSRSESRSRDDQKVDLVNKDEHKNGRLPFNFQCKTSSKKLDYASILKEMPDDECINIILNKLTKKSKEGKFMPNGEFVILNLDDFLNLLNNVRTNIK